TAQVSLLCPTIPRLCLWLSHTGMVSAVRGNHCRLCAERDDISSRRRSQTSGFCNSYLSTLPCHTWFHSDRTGSRDSEGSPVDACLAAGAFVRGGSLSRTGGLRRRHNYRQAKLRDPAVAVTTRHPRPGSRPATDRRR